MPKAKVYNMKAEEVGSLTLKESVFGADFNEALIHQVIVAYQNNQRQGTKATLTRAEVRGRSAKPWKQKHTGRARQGSRKAPHMIKGGMAFALKPRDYSQKVNKTAKRAAFVSAISGKLNDKQIIVLESLKLKAPKTKEMVKLLNNFKLERSVLLVLEGANENALRACSNLPNVTVCTAQLLNTYEVVKNNKLLITQGAIKQIEEAYA